MNDYVLKRKHICTLNTTKLEWHTIRRIKSKISYSEVDISYLITNLLTKYLRKMNIIFIIVITSIFPSWETMKIYLSLSLSTSIFLCIIGLNEKGVCLTIRRIWQQLNLVRMAFLTVFWGYKNKMFFLCIKPKFCICDFYHRV